MGGMRGTRERGGLDWLLGAGAFLALLGVVQVAYGAPAGLFVAIAGCLLIAASAIRRSLSRRP